MSDEKNLNIQINLEMETPDIQIKMEAGGEALPAYKGETIITSRPWSSQILETANRTLKENITVLEIPYSPVSNPQGGQTVYIGE